MKSGGYKPRARSKDLISAELPDELVVLDTRSHKSMVLNAPLALLWRSCTGSNSIAEIAAKLERAQQQRADSGAIWLGLNKLHKARLLEGPPPPRPHNLQSSSRREMMKKLGLGAGALVVGLLPTPAQAASCTPKFGACGAGLPACCAGLHCTGSGDCE